MIICPAIRFCALVFALGLLSRSSSAQESQYDPSVPTLHVGTSLTLVDVLADAEVKALRTRQLLTDLKKQDFRIFDNNQEVPILTLDSGQENTARPLALWLIVQCRMGFQEDWGSGFLRSHAEVLEPALTRLRPADTVGVAHWCDDGSSALDLLPGKDVGRALDTVNALVAEKTHAGENRLGELALQLMIHKVLAAEDEDKGEHLPILLFFYGDHSATYPQEAEKVLVDLLEHSGIVFGVNRESPDTDLKRNLGAPGQISHVIHYFASETGGQYYSSEHVEQFSNAVAYILAQTHLRYVLGFRPPALDGKRHTLRVELTPEASRRYGLPQLRHRPEYIPTPQPK